jgi:hypothetical protein
MQIKNSVLELPPQQQTHESHPCLWYLPYFNWFIDSQLNENTQISSQTCKLKAHSAATVATTTNTQIPSITLAIWPSLIGALKVHQMTIHLLTKGQIYKMKTYVTGTVAATTNTRIPSIILAICPFKLVP